MKEKFHSFGYKTSPNGLVVVPLNDPLTSGCWKEGEIDSEIARLKSELDDLAVVLKKEAPKEAKKPIFGKQKDAQGT